MAICKKCGGKIDNENNICSVCGTPVEDTLNMPPYNAELNSKDEEDNEESDILNKMFDSILDDKYRDNKEIDDIEHELEEEEKDKKNWRNVQKEIINTAKNAKSDVDEDNDERFNEIIADDIKTDNKSTKQNKTKRDNKLVNVSEAKDHEAELVKNSSKENRKDFDDIDDIDDDDIDDTIDEENEELTKLFASVDFSPIEKYEDDITEDNIDDIVAGLQLDKYNINDIDKYVGEGESTKEDENKTEVDNNEEEANASEKKKNKHSKMKLFRRNKKKKDILEETDNAEGGSGLPDEIINELLSVDSDETELKDESHDKKEKDAKNIPNDEEDIPLDAIEQLLNSVNLDSERDEEDKEELKENEDKREQESKQEIKEDKKEQEENKQEKSKQEIKEDKKNQEDNKQEVKEDKREQEENKQEDKEDKENQKENKQEVKEDSKEEEDKQELKEDKREQEESKQEEKSDNNSSIDKEEKELSMEEMNAILLGDYDEDDDTNEPIKNETDDGKKSTNEDSNNNKKVKKKKEKKEKKKPKDKKEVNTGKLEDEYSDVFDDEYEKYLHDNPFIERIKKTVSKIFGNVEDPAYAKKEVAYEAKQATKKKLKDQEAVKKKAAKVIQKEIDKADSEVKKEEKKKFKEEEAAKKRRRKEARKRTLLAEAANEPKTRINKLGATIVLLFFTILATTVIVYIMKYSYDSAIKRANDYYNREQYDKAYEEIAGLKDKLKDEDEKLYEKLRVIQMVNNQVSISESYKAIDMKTESLNHLLVSVAKYDEYIKKAKELQIDKRLDVIFEGVKTRLKDEYSLSIEEARKIVSIADKAEYTDKLNKLCNENKDTN